MEEYNKIRNEIYFLIEQPLNNENRTKISEKSAQIALISGNTDKVIGIMYFNLLKTCQKYLSESRRKKTGLESDSTKVSYIYLIREREFLNTNQNIYKVGRTTQEPHNKIKRLQDYKKGSEIILVIKVPNEDVVSIEDTIKKEFKTTFKSHTDGCEYFEGDIDKMKRIVVKHTILI